MAFFSRFSVKTRVTIRGPEDPSVDFLEEKQFVFLCDVISDPSRPAIVRWYKTEPYGDLVRDEPPYIYVENRFLIIMVYPNCSSDCAKNLGEYRCIGDNGYSRENQTITISYEFKPPPGKHDNKLMLYILRTIPLMAFDTQSLWMIQSFTLWST